MSSLGGTYRSGPSSQGQLGVSTEEEVPNVGLQVCVSGPTYSLPEDPTSAPPNSATGLPPQPLPPSGVTPVNPNMRGGKSTLWADLIPLRKWNISGPKTNPPISTVNKDKDMGSDSGMGRAVISGLGHPPNPVLGVDVGIKMGKGEGGGSGLGVDMGIRMGVDTGGGPGLGVDMGVDMGMDSNQGMGVNTNISMGMNPGRMQRD